jgi:N-acyl-phosphatidylethanolamine-hydrolysing phospholipase D
MANNKHHHAAAGYRNNYVASVTKSLRDVLRWQWQRYRQKLPPDPEIPTPTARPDMDFILHNAGAGTDMVRAVTWLGHATSLVQASGLNVLTDPIFSQRASPLRFAGPRRAQLPGIALEALPHIDVVVISHNHYDHLDRDSIVSLATQPGGSPLFLVPLGIKAWMVRLGITSVAELDWWDVYRHPASDGRSTEFHFTPAQHWSARSPFDRNKMLWGAWSVLGEDFQWFFSGDTGYSKDFVDTQRYFAERQSTANGGGFDVALIAVGACEPRWFMQEQHVDPAEAVQIHLDLRAKRSVGVHWGTFALADEPLDHPVKALARAREARGVPEEEFALMAVGETRRFPPRRS